MNKIQLALKTIGATLNENSPSIMIGLGVSGLIGAAVMAVKVTPIAISLIDEEVRCVHTDDNPDLDWNTLTFRHTISERCRMIPRESIINLCWKLYIPSIATAGLGATAVILGNRLHLRRTAVLASLYSLADTTLQTYQQKVVETVGKKKADTILAATNTGMIPEDPKEENIHNIGGGTELCYEISTGRYFYSDVARIRSAENLFNKELMTDNEKPMNDLFYLLGLPNVSLGDHAGWNVDDGLLEIRIDSRISTNGERPCLVIDYMNSPKALWQRS